MIRNFKYFILFTSAPCVLPEQNDQYRIQPWKVNEIKAYNDNHAVGNQEKYSYYLHGLQYYFPEDVDDQFNE